MKRKPYDPKAICAKVQKERRHKTKFALFVREKNAELAEKELKVTKSALNTQKKETQMHKQKLQEIEQKKQAAIEKAKKTRRRNQKKI
jgi:protein subunit release factor B